MSGTGENDAQALAALRGRIDAIDVEVHRLLVQRGTVIDALIKTKGTSRPGAAFRPGREADMMRRLVDRHDGALPLTTVEHIWREIITTFTHMQADFSVAIDTSVECDRMRDLARFYFGFSVDLISLPNAESVVARVAEAGDLGLIVREQRANAKAWWRGLTRPNGPRIMALLPHIGVKGRPADLPAFVISPRLADPTPPEIRILALSVRGDFAQPRDGVVLAQASEDGAHEILLAVPAAQDAARVAAETGGRVESVVEVGGVARGITIDEAPSLLYQRLDQARTIA
jgi:chorismate mutase / prephenate dehydratase